MSDKDEALRLADELVAPVGTQSTYSVMQQAAAELRRLHTLAMDQQGDIYGLTFARETERKIHNLFKVECDALRALLLRLRAWDMMDASADGEFWKREIDAAIDAAREGK